MPPIPCTDSMKIDYAKLAETGGFKTTASARAGWHTIRKKMGIGK